MTINHFNYIYVCFNLNNFKVMHAAWTQLNYLIKYVSLLHFIYSLSWTVRNIRECWNVCIITDLELRSLYVAYCVVCCLTVIYFVAFALFYVLIIRFMFFIIRFMFVSLFCMFCFIFCIFCVSVLFYAMFLLMYTAVSFTLLHKFKDHCHWVETQLQ